LPRNFHRLGSREARRNRRPPAHVAALAKPETRCDLEWSQVEFDRAATLHVRRAKNGKPAAHPIRGDELRALRELQRHTSSAYVFETERGTPFTTDAVNRLIKRIGERTGFPFLRPRAGQCGA